VLKVLDFPDGLASYGRGGGTDRDVPTFKKFVVKTVLEDAKRRPRFYEHFGEVPAELRDLKVAPGQKSKLVMATPKGNKQSRAAPARSSKAKQFVKAWLSTLAMATTS
jgi:hypothetical protein